MRPTKMAKRRKICPTRTVTKCKIGSMSDRARRVRQKIKNTQDRCLCPTELDVSDKKYKNTQDRRLCPTELDMSDKKYKNTQDRRLCPTELDVSDKNEKNTQDMSDRARCVLQK